MAINTRLLIHSSISNGWFISHDNRFAGGIIIQIGLNEGIHRTDNNENIMCSRSCQPRSRNHCATTSGDIIDGFFGKHGAAFTEATVSKPHFYPFRFKTTFIVDVSRDGNGFMVFWRIIRESNVFTLDSQFIVIFYEKGGKSHS